MDELERRVARAPALSRKWSLSVLNRALKKGKTAASAAIRKDVTLSKKKLDRAISTRVLTERGVAGYLRVRAARFELAEYMTAGQIKTQWARQQKAKFGKRGQRRRAAAPLKVRVYKSEGRRAYPDHFVNIGRRSRRWHVMSKSTSQGDVAVIRYGPPITERFVGALEKFAAEQLRGFNAELLRVLKVKVPL